MLLPSTAKACVIVYQYIERSLKEMLLLTIPYLIPLLTHVCQAAMSRKMTFVGSWQNRAHRA